MKKDIKNDKKRYLEVKLENEIKNKFPVAYDIANYAPVYLVGGTIRDLMIDKEPKDLDFIILGTEYSRIILEVFQKYNITFTYNHFGGYKINYKGIQIDLWTNNDLYSAVQYNVDGLFFYLNDNILLSFSFDDFIKNGLRIINSENNIESCREEKLKKFEKILKRRKDKNDKPNSR